MIESFPSLLATLLGVLAFVAIGRLLLADVAPRVGPSSALGRSPALDEPSAVAVDRRQPGTDLAAARFARWLVRARPSVAASDRSFASTDRPPRPGATRRWARAIDFPPPFAGRVPTFAGA